MEFERPKRRLENINLIPFINVIFLLLIFFMVAGTVENIEIIEVQVPEAQSGDDNYSKNNIVYIGREGLIAVNDDIVQDKDFETIISTILINGDNSEIKVKADSKLNAIRLIDVLQKIEKVGIKNISLITQTKNEGV